MSATPTNPPRSFPLWLKAGCSAFAVGHLLIIGLNALASQSGPWLMPPPFNGASMAEGPQFARYVTQQATSRYYLEPLHMTHNYRFATNRPDQFAVYFEVQVKDRHGEVKTLKFPDPKANFWVRHRQELLAQHLTPPEQPRPRGPKKLMEEGDEVPKVEIWKSDGERTLRLALVPENDPIFDRPDLEEPTPRVHLLVKSYTRYVAKKHEAASAQLVRHSRLTVMPSDLYVPRSAEVLGEWTCYFGEYRRD